MAARLLYDSIGKRYGQAVALDSLSLAIEPGEIFGFLGPNGAGKTTAIHLAMGLLRPTSGYGELLGQPFSRARAARARVGYVPDAPVFFAGTALENVLFAGRLNESATGGSAVRGESALRARAGELLRWMDLPPEGKDARRFSRGMQQRLALAQALVHRPELLILDEPASALDPPAVAQIRDALIGAREDGAAVFFSSHQLNEVEQICDRAAFLSGGRLLQTGPMATLLSEGANARVVLRGLARDHTLVQHWQAALARDSAETQRDAQRGDLVFRVPVTRQRALLEQAWTAGAELIAVQREHRSLADLFATREASQKPAAEQATPQVEGKPW
jgi:ABC-2 type transport system ATP-binding protein